MEIETIYKKLNPYFENNYKNFENLYENQNAYKFISPRRIDIIIAILFCEYLLKISPSKINKVLYYLYLKQFNNFNGKDSYKKCFKDYVDSFSSLIKSIVKNGFDSNKTIIPIDQDNKIIDGVHRIAVTTVLDKKITVAKFNKISPIVDLRRLDKFYDFRKSLYIFDYLILKYIKYNKLLRIICLFPKRNRAFDQKSIEILKSYGEIILTKKIGIGNLVNGNHIVKNFYYGAEWIGNLGNNYEGVQWKTNACFKNTDGILDIILFLPKKKEYSSKENLKEIKIKIRNIYNIHFHSIHSSDNHIETIKYSYLFFNENSQKILIKRKNLFFNNLEKVLDNLNDIAFPNHNFVFSGSSVLASLGLREPKDFDIIHINDFDMPEELSSHNSQVRFLNIKKDELIFNPKNYYYYMGYKFLNPEILLNLKINRNKIKENIKDQKDIELIKNFIISKN